MHTFFHHALGGFFLLGSFFGFYAGVTLLWPGTVLDRLWVINPANHEQMLKIGGLIGLPFLLLSASLLVVGLGWLHHRRWAWQAGVGVLALSVVGDIGRFVVGMWREGLLGIVIGGLFLAYMLSQATRAQFTSKPSAGDASSL